MTPSSRTRLRTIVRKTLPLVIIAVIFVLVLPKIADFGAVLDSIKGLSAGEISLLAAVAIINVATFGPPWMAAMPGLGYLHSMQLTMASTALANAAPGGDAAGMAVSYKMLRQWGMDGPRIAAAVLATGAWNQLVNVGVPVFAAAALTLTGEQGSSLLTATALIGLAALIVVTAAAVFALRSDSAAHRVGTLADRLAQWALHLIRRPRATALEHHLVRVRGEAAGLIRRRWAALTVTTIVGHLTVFLVLLAALRTLGVGAGDVSFLEALAAWGLVRLLTAIPITPGGIGIVELGLTTALVGFGGRNEDVVAAVLLYRALTFLPPLPLGAIAFLWWRRSSAKEAADVDLATSVADPADSAPG